MRPTHTTGISVAIGPRSGCNDPDRQVHTVYAERAAMRVHAARS
jgi:hypothetical protein